MSADLLERVRMCLAEAGYDPTWVEWDDEFGGIVVPGWFHMPLFAAWKAGAVAGYVTWCWPCRREFGWDFTNDKAPEPCGHPIDPFCSEDAEVAW